MVRHTRLDGELCCMTVLCDSNGNICVLYYADHDYGCDNGDVRYPHKYETTNAFIDFLGEPMDSPMAQRAVNGHGVYGVKLFDFDRLEGHQLVPDYEACIDPHAICGVPSLASPIYSNKTVAVFVLDVRTNKDPWLEGNLAYYPEEVMGDFLGAEQWQWFEQAISNSRAAVNVVVNGLQVHANIFSNPNIAESWSAFPRSQQRLMDAILGDTVSSPILISGDVHMTQMMRKDCRRRDDFNHQRPVVEMTTSGMTHSWGRVSSRPLGKADHKPSLKERVEVFVGSTAMHIMHHLRPWTQIMVSSDDPAITHDGGRGRAKKGLQYSLERNFGELEFDWEHRMVSLRSIGEDGKPLLSSKIQMDQLSGRKSMSTSFLVEDDFQREIAEQHPLVGGDWVCLPYRGRIGVIHEMLGHVRSVLAILSIFTLPVVVPAYLFVRRRRKNVSMGVSRPTARM